MHCKPNIIYFLRNTLCLSLYKLWCLTLSPENPDSNPLGAVSKLERYRSLLVASVHNQINEYIATYIDIYMRTVLRAVASAW